MTAPFLLEVLVPSLLVELDLLAWLALATPVYLAHLLCCVSPIPCCLGWWGLMTAAQDAQRGFSSFSVFMTSLFFV